MSDLVITQRTRTRVIRTSAEFHYNISGEVWVLFNIKINWCALGTCELSEADVAKPLVLTEEHLNGNQESACLFEVTSQEAQDSRHCPLKPCIKANSK
jgi:hypothetical protein